MISTSWGIFLDMTDQNSMQSHVKSGLRSGYSSLNGESMGKAIVIFFDDLVKYKLYIIDKYRLDHTITLIGPATAYNN